MRTYPNRERHLAQRKVLHDLEAGRIVRPDHCSTCKKPGRPLIDFDDLAHKKVVWVCGSCYRKRHPWRRRRKVREAIKTCPSYEIMRRDYVDLGRTISEMAQIYGVSKRTIECTLKRRAIAHGDAWPLQRTLHRTVNPVAIAELVRHYIQEHYNSKPIVRVAVRAADGWAPHSSMQWRMNHGKLRLEHRTYWPEKAPPRYHDLGCGRIVSRDTGHAVPSFLIDAIEAEWWGYRPCERCRGKLRVAEFARMHGFNEHWVARLVRDCYPAITTPFARRLLEAIGEPVPEWMLDVDEEDVAA